MSERPLAERTNQGRCIKCDAPRPPGRVKYCGDECDARVRAERQRHRQDQQQAACKMCQGPKEPGTRGSKYCAACREARADASAHIEYERNRRRVVRRLAERESNGDVIRRRSDAPDGQKWCARCQRFRPLMSFPGRVGAKKASYCKPCQKGYNRERRVKLQFGLTWDEYELLLATQDDRCAICGGKPRKHALAVDHDHKTGEIRGLLCSRCNHRLLGAANDDPARLRKAADYLEQYVPREVFGDPRFVPGFRPGDADLGGQVDVPDDGRDDDPWDPYAAHTIIDPATQPKEIVMQRGKP